MTIHLPHSNELAELRRVLELIQREHAKSVSTLATTVKTATASSSGSIGAVGATGATGAAGADGSTASMLVGAEHAFEVLMASDGGVLTDENGYALIGVKVYSTIITGAGTSSFEVLNAT